MQFATVCSSHALQGNVPEKRTVVTYTKMFLKSRSDKWWIRKGETFKKLYFTKWSELISHHAPSTLSEAKVNKPSTLPFTQDVQLLHKHLLKTSDVALEHLKEAPTPQNYSELATATLARIIVFNRRRAGEVSKMLLKSFQKRDGAELHHDVALSFTDFEQKLWSL